MAKENILFKIVGLRVIPFVNDYNEDDYNDSDNDGHQPFLDKRYEILLQAASGKNYQLSLQTTHGMCGSGYCGASWSEESLDLVADLGPLTHKILANPSRIGTAGTVTEVSIACEVPQASLFRIAADRAPETFWLPDTFSGFHFSWTGDGGCNYYPSGGVEVELGLFNPTGREREKPMVHVFMGDSGLGKSTIGRLLSGVGVYETDSSEVFKKEMVFSNVIVLGEKHPEQTFGGIEKFFEKHKIDVELVPVRFGTNVKMEA